MRKPVSVPWLLAVLLAVFAGHQLARGEPRLSGSLLKSGELDRAAVDDYLNGVLAQLQDPAQRQNAHQVRHELVYRHLRKAGRAENSELIEYFNGQLLEKLPPLANSDAPLFTRVQAALILGDLDRRSVSLNGRTPPVPEPRALPVLLDLLSHADQPAAIRIAALRGIDRHCRFGIPGEELRAMTLDRLLSVGTAVSGNPQDAGWLLVHLCAAVGHLGEPGKQGEATVWLHKLAADSMRPLPHRLHALRAIGYLKLGGRNATGTLSLDQLVAEVAARAANPNLTAEQVAMLLTALQGPDTETRSPGVQGVFGAGRGIASAVQEHALKNRVLLLTRKLQARLAAETERSD